MTTFTPVRDAYQAWLRTADQLTFDGALEDSRRDGAAPAVSPSSANPAGILESIEGALTERGTDPGSRHNVPRSVSAPLDSLPVSDHSPGGARTNGFGASATGRTTHNNGTRRKPSRASAAGASQETS